MKCPDGCSTAGQTKGAGRPLSGRRILITRPRAQAASLARLIEERGGEVVEFPVIEIVPPRTYERLDRAIEELACYQWVIFTSVNGVRFFLNRARDAKSGADVLQKIKIAAIGPETARELARHQLKVDLLPGEYRAEGILAGLDPLQVRGARVLLPRAAESREVLPETLRKWGADVDVVEAYRTVPVTQEASRLCVELASGRIDMVTFTSSSTVKAFVALLTGADKGLISRVRAACIGPVTRETAEQAGLQVDVVAREYTSLGLTQAIEEFYAAMDKV
jgi:uroporphyrinogen III methyltransferase/synthase